MTILTTNAQYSLRICAAGSENAVVLLCSMYLFILLADLNFPIRVCRLSWAFSDCLHVTKYLFMWSGPKHLLISTPRINRHGTRRQGTVFNVDFKDLYMWNLDGIQASSLTQNTGKPTLRHTSAIEVQNSYSRLGFTVSNQREWFLCDTHATKAQIRLRIMVSVARLHKHFTL